MTPKRKPAPQHTNQGSSSSHIFDKETGQTFAEIQQGLRGKTPQPTRGRPQGNHPEESAD